MREFLPGPERERSPERPEIRLQSEPVVAHIIEHALREESRYGLLDGVPPRYSARMKLSIELSAAQAERLRHEAERLGLSPEDLARAVVADVLATPSEDFQAAAERVMRKNQELYRRLA